MTETKIDPCVAEKDYFIEKISVSNIPDIGDKTGEQFLTHLEEAVASCRKFIAKGFRLTDFWTDPDYGAEFILKKKKTATMESCDF